MSFWVVAILASGIVTKSLASTNAELPTVPHVDLKRYAGKWYEIARYPNRFQKDCAGDTSATYTLRGDGTVEVVNECRTKKGKTKRAVGTAKVTDRASNSKLKVTFFWPFYGKYWILHLGPEYEYAVVGEPSRKYLWVLSRKPRLDQVVYEELAKKIADVGYDPAKLVRTPQSGT